MTTDLQFLAAPATGVKRPVAENVRPRGGGHHKFTPVTAITAKMSALCHYNRVRGTLPTQRFLRASDTSLLNSPGLRARFFMATRIGFRQRKRRPGRFPGEAASP